MEVRVQLLIKHATCRGTIDTPPDGCPVGPSHTWSRIKLNRPWDPIVRFLFRELMLGCTVGRLSPENSNHCV